MSDVRTLTVCVPETAAVTHQIPAAVSALLAAHGITDAGLAGHFRTKARRLSGRLLRCGTISLLQPVKRHRRRRPGQAAGPCRHA